MSETPTDIVPGVRELAGESLRAAAIYDEDDYEILEERADVAAKFGAADSDAIYEELLLEGIEYGYLESLFHTGDLQSTSAIFEEAVVMHFPAPDHTGLFLSFDASGTLPLIEIANLADQWIDELPSEGITIEEG